MDKEIKKLLEENLKVSEETLRMTKKLRRDQWYHRIFNLAKWLIVLGILAWGYTQVQPFLEQFLGVFNNVQEFSENLPSIPGF